MSISIGIYGLAFFHILTHTLFKALLPVLRNSDFAYGVHKNKT
jgi:hypothetical protein